MAMSAVHAYWAAGGEWGLPWHFSPRFDPVVQYGVVAVFMLGSAVLLLARSGVLAIDAPGPLLRAGPGVIAGVLAVIGLSNVLLPAEAVTTDWVYAFGALALVMAVLSAIVAGASLPAHATVLATTTRAMWIGLFDVRPEPGSGALEGALGAAVYAAAAAPDRAAFEAEVRRAAGKRSLVVTAMEDAEPATASAVRALGGDGGRLISGHRTVAWGTLHPYDSEE